MGSTESAAISSSTQDKVRLLRLSSAPANALGEEFLSALDAELDDFRASDDRALVISSTVPGFFMAGGDINLMQKFSAEDFAAYVARTRGALEKIKLLDRPVLCAVEGRAIGGGFEVALTATLRIAGAGASFGLPEIRLGLIPGAGGTQRLTRLVGRSTALQLLLTGRTVKAEEALALGLVDQLAPEGQAERLALEFATKVASLSRPAVAAVLQCVDDAQLLPPYEGMAGEEARINALFASGEAREGLSAFAERRPAKFG